MEWRLGFQGEVHSPVRCRLGLSRDLAEAVALVAMFGAMLKFDGRFILQTSTDGPVSMLVEGI